MKHTPLILIGTFVLVGLVAALMYVNISNREITLRNKIGAQQQACEAYYDKVWKVLKQKAGVTDQYRDSFREIYKDLIGGRYQDQGLLLKFVTESNPTFDPSLYKDLMASIEGERNGFLMEQRVLIDLDREHKTMRQTFPGSLFVGGRADVGITVITSAVTEKVYTGDARSPHQGGRRYREACTTAHNRMLERFDAISLELRLRGATLGKHGGLDVRINGTEAKLLYYQLPELVAAARASYAPYQVPAGARPGKAHERAIGNFSTAADRRRSLKAAESNLAQAQRSGNSTLIAFYAEHLERVKERVENPIAGYDINENED